MARSKRPSRAVQSDFDAFTFRTTVRKILASKAPSNFNAFKRSYEAETGKTLAASTLYAFLVRAGCQIEERYHIHVPSDPIPSAPRPLPPSFTPPSSAPRTDLGEYDPSGKAPPVPASSLPRAALNAPGIGGVLAEDSAVVTGEIPEGTVFA